MLPASIECHSSMHMRCMQAVRQDVKEFVQLRRQTSKSAVDHMHVDGARVPTAEPAAAQSGKSAKAMAEQQVLLSHNPGAIYPTWSAASSVISDTILTTYTTCMLIRMTVTCRRLQGLFCRVCRTPVLISCRQSPLLGTLPSCIAYCTDEPHRHKTHTAHC